MAQFNFPYHTVRVDYKDDQPRVSFGKGFTFTARPVFPIQRTFILTMYGVQWFVDANDEPETTSEPLRNAKLLDEFYRIHRLHLPFDYSAPGHGDFLVTFKSPLKLPEPELNSGGMLASFEIELLEQPA